MADVVSAFPRIGGSRVVKVPLQNDSSSTTLTATAHAADGRATTQSGTLVIQHNARAVVQAPTPTLRPLEDEATLRTTHGGYDVLVDGVEQHALYDVDGDTLHWSVLVQRTLEVAEWVVGNNGAAAYSFTNVAGNVAARYVEVEILDWSGHPSLRVDVTVEGEPDYATPEDAREYSSVYNNDAVGTGHARSLLTSDQAWSATSVTVPPHPQFVRLDLGEVRAVTGVSVMPRVGNSQYATKLGLAFGLDVRRGEAKVERTLYPLTVTLNTNKATAPFVSSTGSWAETLPTQTAQVPIQPHLVRGRRTAAKADAGRRRRQPFSLTNGSQSHHHAEKRLQSGAGVRVASGRQTGCHVGALRVLS